MSFFNTIFFESDLKLTGCPGGPTFYNALLAVGLPDLLSEALKKFLYSPKHVSAALKAMIAVHDGFSGTTCDTDDRLRIDLSERRLQAFVHILSDTTNTSAARLNTVLVCQLLERTVDQDRLRQAVEPYGLVHRLAPHIVSFYVHNHPRSSSLFNLVVGPLPAPPTSQGLAHILGALTALVANSRYRVATLLFSPTIFSVLPFIQSQVRVEPKIHQPAQQSAYDISPRDLSLPGIHTRIEKADNAAFSSAFPALGSSRSGLTSRASGFLDFPDVAPTPDERGTSPMRGSDSAFLAWLVHIMRTTDTACRVKAGALFAIVVKTKYVSSGKDRFIALLVIPLLVDVMKNAEYASGSLQGASHPDPASVAELRALRDVPLVLANLLTEIPSLQKASVEANVIKELCQYLKGTFGPFDRQPRHWSELDDQDVEELQRSMEDANRSQRQLGDSGIPPNVRWMFQCRENGLHLFAALTGKEDSFRKKLVENGMLQCIIDSLKPMPSETSSSLSNPKEAGSRKEKLDAEVGNPDSVLIAACLAAKSMSRSVSLMRTSLVDAALAKPIYALMLRKSPDVILAATEVICNLVMDFSPMRSDLVDEGVITTLCDQAHESEPRLRGTSLWALKHLVSQAPEEVKIACIRGLGPAWLDQIISSSPSALIAQKAQPFSTIHGANSRGERVNILQPPEDELMSEPEPSRTGRSATDKSAKFSLGASTPTRQPGHSAYLAEVRRAEEGEAAAQPEQEQVRIQVHALDILRNMTTGQHNNEMIEHLYEKFGTQRVFDIIASKLRPLPTAGPALPTPHISGELGGQDMVQRFYPAAILTSTIFVLSHIAASAPRNRQHLIAQTQLLGLVRALYRYPDQDVRVSCLWIAINLMWVDDASDQPGARARQQAMAQMGFREEIRARMDDTSYDVMERARTANDLIEGRPQPHSSAAGARGPPAR